MAQFLDIEAEEDNFCEDDLNMSATYLLNTSDDQENACDENYYEPERPYCADCQQYVKIAPGYDVCFKCRNYRESEPVRAVEGGTTLTNRAAKRSQTQQRHLQIAQAKLAAATLALRETTARRDQMLSNSRLLMLKQQQALSQAIAPAGFTVKKLTQSEMKQRSRVALAQIQESQVRPQLLLPSSTSVVRHRLLLPSSTSVVRPQHLPSSTSVVRPRLLLPSSTNVVQPRLLLPGSTTVRR